MKIKVTLVISKAFFIFIKKQKKMIFSPKFKKTKSLCSSLTTFSLMLEQFWGACLIASDSLRVPRGFAEIY